MTRPIIGFCGLAKSGKDTAGAFAVQMGYKRFAFGDKLKEALIALNPAIGLKGGQPVYLKALVNQVGMEEAKHHAEVRKLLQRMGTEVGRETIHPDTWITAVARAIEEYEISTRQTFERDGEKFGTQEQCKVAITDVRFPNEADWVRNSGGIVAQIIRPGIEPLRDEKGRIHKSELHVMNGDLKTDYVVMNDSSLESFQERIHDMIDIYERMRADANDTRATD